MKNERDLIRVRHMLEAIDRIKRFTADRSDQDFFQDELRQAGVIRQFEIIGEAAALLSPEMIRQFPAVPWRQLRTFRNLLIHEYFRVDAAEVWAVITNDLSSLQTGLLDAAAWLAERP